jgi:hypothetical protein
VKNNYGTELEARALNELEEPLIKKKYATYNLVRKSHDTIL